MPRIRAVPSRVSFLCLAAVILVGGGCGSDRPGGSVPTGDAGVDANLGPCSDGEIRCMGQDAYTCRDGALELEETCDGDLVCVPDLGCRTCFPGRVFCDGNDVRACGDDGMSSTPDHSCGEREVCQLGVCLNACDAAREDRSTVGCDYFAVDLDNAWGEGSQGFGPDPSNEQFAVVLANPSNETVTAAVTYNDGQPGSALLERQQGSYTIAPHDLVRIDLPAREVDGSFDGMNEGPGTYLSSQAYRIRTNYPVVAYQFNPIDQSYSNDASLLIPVTGLDDHYRVMNWPTANPAVLEGGGALGTDLEGIPDHSYVTIVGTEPNTMVTVTVGFDTVEGGGVPASMEGGQVQVVLGPYDVLNLETATFTLSIDDILGGFDPSDLPGVPDMTGTVVASSAPVAVFSGNERGIAPIDTTGVPSHPDGAPERWCCTEHMEEQVFPTTSWGSDFVITRSPVRSNHATWKEPDLYRVMADKADTEITTNLPAPNDHFTLGVNEWVDFATDRSFIMRATRPVSIQQVLVSQEWVVSWKNGHGGDPSLIFFPPFQQYREDYVFLVPDTFSTNYVVMAAPVGTEVLLDGAPIDGDELMALCTYEPTGDIDGTSYEAVTCPVAGGAHQIESSIPVGLTVYGYHNVGSYGYAGGSNLERINPLI